MDIISLLITLGIVQGFFLGIVLLTINRGNRKANRVLGVLMILFSLSISHAVLYGMNLYERFPHFLMVSHPLPFLFGPLFLLYVLYQVRPDFHLKPLHLLHIIPFILYVGYLMPFYLLSGPEKLAYVEGWNTRMSWVEYVVTPLQIVSIYVYLYIVNRILHKHETRLKRAFASIEDMNLSWIRTMIMMFAGVFAMMAVLVVIAILGYTEFVTNHAMDIIALMVSAAIYITGYAGLRQPEIFTGESVALLGKAADKPTQNEDQVKPMLAKLKRLMEEEQLYRINDLSLQRLADAAEIPAYLVSQVINDYLGQNFFDFVNRYRVEDVCRQLRNPANGNLTILSLAFDAGFNSKSVFNTAFKKYMGTTPSQYRDDHLPG